MILRRIPDRFQHGSSAVLVDLLMIMGILLALSPGCAGDAGGGGAIEIPARFVEQRIFVQGVSAEGDTLVFYTDTGGGQNMLYATAADRFSVEHERVAVGPDTVTAAACRAGVRARGFRRPRTLRARSAVVSSSCRSPRRRR